MKLGAVFPQTEIGTDPVAIRDYAQAVEEMGFDHIIAYDHVIGADTKNRPEWNMPYTSESVFHEPLVLFSYLAGVTTKLEFASGVMILPQRQAALVAKQAANVDVFSGGRLRLAVGIGWNDIEYEALGVPFRRKGARLDEQMDFMRRLWTEESFSFKGEFHRITEAGINPLPLQRPIPLWVGGNSEPAIRRAAEKGDGWLPVQSADNAEEVVGSFYEKVAQAGRKPEQVGLENIIFVGTTIGGPKRTFEDAAADFEAWKKAGATGACVHTMGADLGGADLEGADGHIEFLRRFSDALK